ncbi:MAG: hypothetical protein RIS83_1728, partial [Pseudomonadota bacterium]
VEAQPLPAVIAQANALTEAPAPLPPPVVAPATEAPRSVTKLVGRRMEEVDRELILETLSHCLGNRTRAAEMLGISIRTLRNKLHEYRAAGVEVPPVPGQMPTALPVD